MLQDGLYELLYRAEADTSCGFDSLLLALRNGKVLGSDRWGGVFLGDCVFDRARDEHTVKVRFHVPAGGMLVTDDRPRMRGSAIDLSAVLAGDRDGSLPTRLVDLGGQRVEVALKFKGPVPI